MEQKPVTPNEVLVGCSNDWSKDEMSIKSIIVEAWGREPPMQNLCKQQAGWLKDVVDRRYKDVKEKDRFVPGKNKRCFGSWKQSFITKREKVM